MQNRRRIRLCHANTHTASHFIFEEQHHICRIYCAKEKSMYYSTIS